LKAALLIDWENFAARLSGRPYWRVDPSPVVQPLVEAVVKHAADLGATLEERWYFLAAEKEITRETRTALTGAGFNRVDATAAKNGADTRLIVYATRQQLKGVEVFYVVTGDEDFADLAWELQREGAKCFLCPIDGTRLKGPIQEWPDKVYVKDGFIPLSAGTEPPPNAMDQLMICLHALNDTGKHLGDWNSAAAATADRFGLGGVIEVNALMQKAKTDNLIWEGPVEINGEAPKRRRLRYETPTLKRLLTAADAMLEEVKRRRDIATYGDLLNAIPGESKVALAGLPDILVRAGYLDHVGGNSYKLLPLGERGLLRPLRRIALSVWHLGLQNPKRKGVAPARVRDQWARHEFPAQHRDLTVDQQTQAGNAARAVIKRGLATGVLLENGGREGDTDHGPFGYITQEMHPIVQETVAAAEAVWKLLPADLSSVDKVKVIDGLAELSKTKPELGSTDRHYRFWLDAMASEGIIYMRQGRVYRGKNSPLRKIW
jgi:hypothetical protein